MQVAGTPENSPMKISFELQNGEYSPVISPYQFPESAIPEGQDPDFYQKVLDSADGANETYQIAQDPHSKTKVETAVFTGNDRSSTKLFGSTSNSSLETNSGNVVEAAVRAAGSNNERYIAFYGNGRSTRLRRLARFMFSGRLSDGDGSKENPYRPTKQNQQIASAIEALDTINLPSSIEGDVEGARFILGVACGLKPDSIKSGVLNNPVGVSSKSYSMTMLSEDLKGKFASGTEWSPKNSDLSRDVMQKMPVLSDRNALQKAATVLRWVRSTARQLGPYPLAFGRHKDIDRTEKHALIQDSAAFLTIHEATLQMIFNELGKGYDIERLAKFGTAIMNSIPEDRRSEARKLEIIARSDGTLDEHTIDPSVRLQTLPEPKGRIIPIIGNLSYRLRNQPALQGKQAA